MAISKLFVAQIAAFVAFAAVSPLLTVAAAAASDDEALPTPIAALADEFSAAAALAAELEQLRTKVAALESSNAEKVRELKQKNEGIERLEVSIGDKSDVIALLHRELSSLREKRETEALEWSGKADARVDELQKEVGKLQKEVEAGNVRHISLEALVDNAEKKAQELICQMEALQKINDEQQRRIEKIERALKSAEEELAETRLEASAKSEQLTQVHGASLPPWVKQQAAVYLELVSREWNEHAKPTVDILKQQSSEKLLQARKWSGPHIETARTKWIPIAKEKLDVLTTNAGPYVKSISSKSVEFFEASRDAISPHVIKVQEFVDPYYQEAKRLSKPHIDQIAEFTKPHVEKIRIVVKPYTNRVVDAYGNFLQTATEYHHQAQATISDYLQKHGFTTQLATKELVWFLASALLALPAYFLCKLVMHTCTKRTKKSTRQTGNHSQRRHKRRHTEK